MWRDLFREKSAPGFPVSHLHPSYPGKSPAVSSARPKQRPKSRVSVSCEGLVLCSPHGLLQPQGAVDLHGHMSPSKREHINKWGECGSPNERELLIVFLGLYPLSL